MKDIPKNTEGDIVEYLDALKTSPRFGPQVIHETLLASCSAHFGDLERPWPPELAAALEASGIHALFTHQADALNRVRAGESVVVATPTASGKSLIYHLPVLESCIVQPGTKALYLFPLKALAQDQHRALQQLAGGLPKKLRPSMAIYDGDTSSYLRRRIREKMPNILISNPEMLHLSLLGYHGSWGPFFAELRHVIIDEVHTYRGVFGSHMAWVLRRLQRICRLYGAKPNFILSSATIANPAELAQNLLGFLVPAITDNGAPQGKRHIILVNPSDSPAFTASQFMEAAMKRGLRTIVYTQSRKLTELIYVWTMSRMGNLQDKLSSYRAGFLPEERRDIEGRLASGELLGVVSTSALELGIDIGGLDLCILVGYPGSMMAFWQRGGRVGRSQKESAMIFIGQEDALDQYFMRNPEHLLNRAVEAAVLNPGNRVLAQRHLLCAAAEHPISTSDPILAEEGVIEIVAELAKNSRLLLSADGTEWFGSRTYPHREVDLRGTGASFTIRAPGDGCLLGTIDGIRCFTECHPGAIYLHRGQTYLITELDLEAHVIMADRREVNYFTRSMSSKTTEILATSASKTLYNFRVSLGVLRVTQTVTGFQRRLSGTQRLIATEPLDLPPQTFETEGLWLEIPHGVQAGLEKAMFHFMGGIHALEHAAIGIFPLVVLCDRNDVGGISQPLHPQLQGAAIFVYDAYPGGVGLSRIAFQRIETLLQATRSVIEACRCASGCPSCVHSPKCGSGNRPIDKEAARRVLDGILQSSPAAGQTWKPVPQAHRTEPKPQRIVPGRYGVLDLETQLSAAEVGGWHRADRMKISIAVLYDSLPDEYLVFRDHEIKILVDRLKNLDLLIGFNIKAFDSKVLSAYTDFDFSSMPCLDILEEVQKQLGYRLSLAHLTEHTLGAAKSGDGLQALTWFRQGRFDLIIDYCKKDVELTRDLFLYGLANRHLLFRNKAGSLVQLPVHW